MQGSGRSLHNIDRGTVLLGWNTRQKDDESGDISQMTISRIDFSEKDFSVIACLTVFRLATIFFLSYFLSICYFGRMKYLCFC